MCLGFVSLCEYAHAFLFISQPFLSFLSFNLCHSFLLSLLFLFFPASLPLFSYDHTAYKHGRLSVNLFACLSVYPSFSFSLLFVLLIDTSVTFSLPSPMLSVILSLLLSLLLLPFSKLSSSSHRP